MKPHFLGAAPGHVMPRGHYFMDLEVFRNRVRRLPQCPRGVNVDRVRGTSDESTGENLTAPVASSRGGTRTRDPGIMSAVL